MVSPVTSLGNKTASSKDESAAARALIALLHLCLIMAVNPKPLEASVNFEARHRAPEKEALKPMPLGSRRW
jgi:hypothetical protein